MRKQLRSLILSPQNKPSYGNKLILTAYFTAVDSNPVRPTFVFYRNCCVFHGKFLFWAPNTRLHKLNMSATFDRSIYR